MDKQKNSFYHAIKVNTDVCIGCSHCMKVCPTQAIRISGGHAGINKNRCIDCGECYRVCPVNAIYVDQDDFKKRQEKKVKALLVPSVFIGQFPEIYTKDQIFETVKKQGFTHVFEVEQAVDAIIEFYKNYSESDNKMPVISTYCPAIVRLIQVAYPSLCDNFIPVKAPHDVAALYFREYFKEQGINREDTEIFYITPCAAKIASVKEPVGEDSSEIDVVINMNTLFNLVYSDLVNKTEGECNSNIVSMNPDSVTWSLTGTEKKYYRRPCLAIDGVSNVIEFLEKLEEGNIPRIDFLELRACDQGCAGGILCTGNRFLCVERLEKRRDKLHNWLEKGKTGSNPVMNRINEIYEDLRVDNISPRPGMLLDSDTTSALKKMEALKKIENYLPGFDCGACGAPTCKALAEDIVNEKASLSHCVFVQRIMEKNYKLSPDQAFKIIETIWGENRLNKI